MLPIERVMCIRAPERGNKSGRANKSERISKSARIKKRANKSCENKSSRIMAIFNDGLRLRRWCYGDSER